MRLKFNIFLVDLNQYLEAGGLRNDVIDPGHNQLVSPPSKGNRDPKIRVTLLPVVDISKLI